MSTMPPPTPTSNSQPRKSSGCFFYGCLGLAVVGLIGLIVLYFGYRYVSKLPDQLVNQYTDTNATQLGQVTLSEEELKTLQERIALFGQALENPTNAQELVLTADEINGMFASERKATNRNNFLYVRIENNVIMGDVSFPFPDDIGPFKLKGRYLNGAATFKVLMDNQKLDIRVDQIKVKDKPLPALLLAELRKQNLAQEAKNDPEVAKFLDQIDSIEVKDNKLVVRNKYPPTQ